MDDLRFRADRRPNGCRDHRLGEEHLAIPGTERKGSQGGKPDGKNDVASELNIVTEYLLLGSLVSWMLALGPVVLFR